VPEVPTCRRSTSVSMTRAGRETRPGTGQEISAIIRHATSGVERAVSFGVPGSQMEQKTRHRTIVTHALLSALTAYRVLLAPIIGGTCRFLPSCSRYAEEAIACHGPLRGGWLAVKRVARCHPFGGRGYDPVPDSCVDQRRGS
jgi:putative membrane protein insertion efficiency factor